MEFRLDNEVDYEFVQLLREWIDNLGYKQELNFTRVSVARVKFYHNHIPQV